MSGFSVYDKGARQFSGSLNGLQSDALKDLRNKSLQDLASKETTESKGADKASFIDVLKEGIVETNDMQKAADKMAERVDNQNVMAWSVCYVLPIRSYSEKNSIVVRGILIYPVGIGIVIKFPFAGIRTLG